MNSLNVEALTADEVSDYTCTDYGIRCSDSKAGTTNGCRVKHKKKKKLVKRRRTNTLNSSKSASTRIAPSYPTGNPAE
jgi:hypothetical protein